MTIKRRDCKRQASLAEHTDSTQSVCLKRPTLGARASRSPRNDRRALQWPAATIAERTSALPGWLRRSQKCPILRARQDLRQLLVALRAPSSRRKYRSIHKEAILHNCEGEQARRRVVTPSRGQDYSLHRLPKAMLGPLRSTQAGPSPRLTKSEPIVATHVLQDIPGRKYRILLIPVAQPISLLLSVDPAHAIEACFYNLVS